MAKKNNIVTDEKALTVPHGLWFFCDIALWHHRCFLFIGSLEEMHDSLCKNQYHTNITRNEANFAIDWIRRLKDLDTAGDAFGTNTASFIRISDFVLGRIDDIAVLEHECLHVANAILSEIGVQGDGNREVLAYTQEFIFKSLMLQMMAQRGFPPNSKR